MKAAAFLLALSRRTPTISPSRDPLADARCFVLAHGETGEGRALRRIINLLATGEGEFLEADVWHFSAETLALVAALVDARIAGIPYSEVEWWR